MPDNTARAGGPWNGLFRDARHGPLPGLLLVLTVTTGTVDAVSILSLGRVFVANMTGNVVFIGFALAGAPGFSLAASLFALGGFLLGALGAGRLLLRAAGNRAVLLRNAVAVEIVALLVALAVALPAGTPVGGRAADVMAAVMAVALGAQNSVVRRLAVPDLTTTVLTMTLTGIAADLRSKGPVVVARRLLAVAAMLAGAVAGALLDLHVDPSAALGLAVVMMAGVLVAVGLAGRMPAPWQD